MILSEAPIYDFFNMIFINKGCESDYADYVGDGYCDDANNNEGCQFDDGDCCGPDINTDYCVECLCYEWRHIFEDIMMSSFLFDFTIYLKDLFINHCTIFL